MVNTEAGHSTTRWVVQLLCWLAVGCCAATLTTQLFDTPNRPIAALQSFTFLIVPVGAGIVLVGWLIRRGVIALAGASVSLAALALLAPLLFPDSGPDAQADATEITIVAANMLFKNDQLIVAADVLGELDADIIAFSEVNVAILTVLREHGLAAAYPHRATDVRERSTGLRIWSKVPLRSITATPGFDRSIDLVADTADGPVRIILVHPPPPVFSPDIWLDEIKAIGSIEHGEDPLLVLGDFNASYFHPPFRHGVNDAGLLDALAARSRGLEMTWPSDEGVPPFVTLDHVLVNDQLAVTDARSFDIPGSDHRGVLATVAIAASSDE